MSYDTTPALAGADLRSLRLIRGVPGAAVARAAGWPRQRVATIEALAQVTRRSADRYLRALEEAAK